jgi:dipeptidyl aminopeptidase/acylaminoacyl peptidase
MREAVASAFLKASGTDLLHSSGLILSGVLLSVPKLRDGEQRVYFKAGGEWCYLWTPKKYMVGGKTPVLMHHHGAGGYVRDGSADWPDTESKATFLRAIMENGIVVAGSHSCGDHWGNPYAVAANAALLKELDATPGLDTSRLGLMGGGLGGTLVWNSVLGPLAGRAKLAAVLQAVANLDATIKEKKFRDVTLKAYGFAPETPDEEAYKVIKPSDPMPKLKAMKKGTKLPRVAIFHGSKDHNIPAETNAIPLAEALRRAVGRSSLTSSQGWSTTSTPWERRWRRG